METLEGIDFGGVHPEQGSTMEVGQGFVQVCVGCACVLLGCLGQPHVPMRDSCCGGISLGHRGRERGTILPGFSF
jgi:hypothetical protein